MKTCIILFFLSIISVFGQNTFSLKEYPENNELFPIQKIENINKIQLSKDSITYIYEVKDNLNLKNLSFFVNNTILNKIKIILKDSTKKENIYIGINDWDETYRILGSRQTFILEDSINYENIKFKENIELKNKQICVVYQIIDDSIIEYKSFKDKITFSCFIYIRFI